MWKANTNVKLKDDSIVCLKTFDDFKYLIEEKLGNEIVDWLDAFMSEYTTAAHSMILGDLKDMVFELKNQVQDLEDIVEEYKAKEGEIK